MVEDPDRALKFDTEIPGSVKKQGGP